EHLISGLAWLKWEIREYKFAERELNIAPVGDLQGVFDRFRDIPEAVGGFITRQKVILSTARKNCRVRDISLSRNCDQGLVGKGVVGSEVVRVLGGDERDV